MTNLREDIWTRLYYDGKYITAELQATLQGCKRWIAIYKTEQEDPLSPWKQPDYLYLVRDFELKEELIDEYFSNEDMQNQKEFYFVSEENLICFLHEYNIDLSWFTYPWRCNYPL